MKTQNHLHRVFLHLLFMTRLRFILIACLPAVAAFAAEPFEPFLETHCVRCHGPEKEKGDLRIDELSRDFETGAGWPISG